MTSKGFTAQLDNSQLLQRWRALAPREQFALASLGFGMHAVTGLRRVPQV